MDYQSEKSLISDFVVTRLAKKKDTSMSVENVNLLESGIIDSLGIMKLITYIEETFSIKIDDDELLPENFESIESISNLVDAKRCVS